MALLAVPRAENNQHFFEWLSVFYRADVPFQPCPEGRIGIQFDWVSKGFVLPSPKRKAVGSTPTTHASGFGI